jgi:quercetin dioxygenase-like cupin family protein
MASLTELAAEHLAEAHSASSGRSSLTVYGGHEHSLRQTLIALAGGKSLGDHSNPGEATLQVLQGKVRLTTAEESWDGTAGDHLPIPEGTHGLEALEDSVVLLTVVKLQ